MKKLITHGGGFHADDVFAYAILKEFLTKQGETWELIRTRDMDEIKSGDIVFDVGEIYDPSTHCYDHHQRGRAGARENGVLYAAAGLVWKHFGKELCNHDTIWEKIDQDIICELDALDNGQDFIKEFVFENTRRFSLATMLNHFESTAFEDKNPEIIKNQFEQASEFARGILRRALHNYETLERAFEEVSNIYNTSTDKEILVLNKNYERPTWKRLAVFPELKFVIYPKDEGDSWKVEAIPLALNTMESRTYAPDAWRGYRGEALQKITGVADATFCHPSGFLFAAVSQQGALELAKKALLM
jgi:uncharacterized UPF0160 family protein